MSLETTASSATAQVSESTDSAPSSDYSLTDPGYNSDEASIGEIVNELEEFKSSKAQRVDEANPSETLDDASDAESETEETVETPAVSDAADSEGISDELLDRAFELGYTVDELKSFSDAKSLETEVTRVEKIQKRLAERQGTKPKEETPVPEPDPEPNWDELIEQGHDPDIVALNKKTWQRAQAAEAQARQVIQAEQNRAFEAQCIRFDETLNKLEGFEAILGKGTRGELAKELAQNRQKVFTKMQGLRQIYELAGEKVPPEAELIQEAVHASFFKHAQQTARSQIKGEIKKAGSQALSRPRSMGSKPLAGPDRALAAEAEFWKKHS